MLYSASVDDIAKPVKPKKVKKEKEPEPVVEEPEPVVEEPVVEPVEEPVEEVIEEEPEPVVLEPKPKRKKDNEPPEWFKTYLKSQKPPKPAKKRAEPKPAEPYDPRVDQVAWAEAYHQARADQEANQRRYDTERIYRQMFRR